MNGTATLPNGSDRGHQAANGPIETTFLIVGAGPAGASLASFLASYGFTGIMISAASGTARQPRAHITNAAALECLRDIDLEEDCKLMATPGESMQHTRWCYTMAGDEMARIHSWGNQPDRRGEYEAASPCRHVDLPQTLLEPILVKNATDKAWKVRFDSSFVEFARDSPTGPITSTIKDEVSGQTYTIRSKYLFGCDGARSQVIRQLDIPLKKEPGQGVAVNILVDVDMTKFMQYRTGNLHWIFQPNVQNPPWAWTALVRMVKAWHEWMFIVMAQPGLPETNTRPSDEEYIKYIHGVIGDDTLPVKIIEVAKWNINEIVAERYSDGNIFCFGDATHRHPPFNGLGSNTCVQDAWNLAWKLAYVERGHADPSLLDTFSVERQPIGEGIVRRANQGLRDHFPVFEALGYLAETFEERKKLHAELAAPTDAGRQRRERLRKAIDYTEHEFGGIGIEMNQQYESSAVYLKDEKAAKPPPPANPVLQYQISTYPGSRLPHAWLNKRTPQKPISTIDLAAHGAFCLITGIRGDGWKEAAKEVQKHLGIDVNVYSVGWCQDWEDVYGDWARRREVEEDGCVLARPDRTVCWRSPHMREDCNEALLTVVKSVLGHGK